jgi:hypothetical protein
MVKSYTRVQFYPPIQSSNGDFYLWKDKLVKAADPGPAEWVKSLIISVLKPKSKSKSN